LIISACPPMAWCGFKRDNAGTGRAQATALFSGVSSLVPLWSYSLSASTGVYSGPMVMDVDGDGIPNIVVGDNVGDLRCFNGPDGVINWSYRASSGIYSTPAAGEMDGDPSSLEVAFVSSNATLYVLSGSDGHLLWSASLGGYTYNGSPRLADMDGDGLLDVIVSTSSGTFVRRGYDGSTIWSSSQGVAIGSVPAVADINRDGYPDVIVADDDSYWLKALNGLDGSLLWSVSIYNSDISSPIVEDIDGDGHYDIIVSSDREIYRVNEDGTLRWSSLTYINLSYDAHESPVSGWDIDGDGVRDIFQSGYFGDTTLMAISGADGSIIWLTTSLTETHGSAPITVGDFDASNPGYEILYNDHDGVLTVIDAATGSSLWSYTYGGGPYGSGYSVLADVNGDTCVDFILRGEDDSPILAVFTSSVYGSCRLSWDDPDGVVETPSGMETPSVEVVGRTLILRGEGRYEILSASGRLLSSGALEGERAVSLGTGAYFVKIGEKVRKVIVR